MDSSFRWNDEGASPRIATLDILRGVAVMGILAMNIVGFAMPYAAYSNPLAYGADGPADLISWAIGFLFIDGKMRGLFCLLFGASMLLVIERAEAAGEPSAEIHLRRMAWLLLFGLVHFYLIWFGDILSLYAPVGMIAWFFYQRSPAALLGWGVALLLVQQFIHIGTAGAFHDASMAAAAADATADEIKAWAATKTYYAIPGPAQVAETLALYRGSYSDILRHTLAADWATPINSLFLFGWETLAYMLFGMAALKTGFLSGDWSDRQYRRLALLGFAIMLPVEGWLAWRLWAGDFEPALLYSLSIAAPVLIRPVMVVSTAALIILLARRAGMLTRRIAAAGRTAFTNYLGTSILMVLLFYGYGLGLYGTMSRAELWWMVIAMWVLMLLWSKPWLDRFRYGPFEWLWRSLARGKVQPMSIMTRDR